MTARFGTSNGEDVGGFCLGVEIHTNCSFGRKRSFVRADGIDAMWSPAAAASQDAIWDDAVDRPLGRECPVATKAAIPANRIRVDTGT